MLYGSLKRKAQSGAALFVSLIFLLILTILGITAMQSTVMQEKMANNFNEYNRAFQSAETVLREAETWLRDRTVEPAQSSSPSSGQVWTFMDAGTDPDGAGTDCSGTGMWWRQCNKTWWTNNAIQGSEDLSAGSITTNPYYVIEKHSFKRDSLTLGRGKSTGRTVYRVTGKGTGAADTSQVMLQTTYARRF